MKNMYKQKIINTVLFYIITIWSCIESFYFTTDYNITQGSMVVSGIIGGALILTGVIIKGIEAHSQSKRAKAAEARKNKLEKQYETLQNQRQAVIDQSDEVRALKDQVFNPYANVGVAVQATNLKLEETDESLANVLDSINQAGAGGGAATQLARMAAVSKAQATAGLEQQEVQNQKLRLQGEAQMMSQKLNIEQMALQEEVAAWGRQENRDVADMARVERLEDRYESRYLMHEKQRSDIVNSIGSDLIGAGASIAGGAGGGGGGTGGVAPANQGGLWGYGDAPAGTTGGIGAGGYAQSFAPGANPNSDRKLKKNINKIGKSPSGLNIYSFEFKDSKYGEGTYEGVMSDEIPSEFVYKDKEGYDLVDYSKLDVEFKELV